MLISAMNVGVSWRQAVVNHSIRTLRNNSQNSWDLFFHKISQTWNVDTMNCEWHVWRNHTRSCRRWTLCCKLYYWETFLYWILLWQVLIQTHVDGSKGAARNVVDLTWCNFGENVCRCETVNNVTETFCCCSSELCNGDSSALHCASSALSYLTWLIFGLIVVDFLSKWSSLIIQLRFHSFLSAFEIKTSICVSHDSKLWNVIRKTALKLKVELTILRDTSDYIKTKGPSRGWGWGCEGHRAQWHHVIDCYI
jgi:hypothetical protein